MKFGLSSVLGGDIVTDGGMDRQMEAFAISHSFFKKGFFKLIVGQWVVTFLSVYAPQSGLSDEVKDLFFDQLRAVTARIPASEFLIPCGD